MLTKQISRYKFILYAGSLISCFLLSTNTTQAMEPPKNTVEITNLDLPNLINNATYRKVVTFTEKTTGDRKSVDVPDLGQTTTVDLALGTYSASLSVHYGRLSDPTGWSSTCKTSAVGGEGDFKIPGLVAIKVHQKGLGAGPGGTQIGCDLVAAPKFD